VTDAENERSPLDPELERRLRDALAGDHADGGVAGDAPAPDVVLDALAGRLPEAERIRVLDAAARTVEGRRDLATLVVAVRAAESAAPVDDEVRIASRWLRRPVAAAATLVIAAGLGGGLWWRTTRGPADDGPLRSGAGAAAGVVLAAPTVDATPDAPPALAWRPVRGAVRYDVEVMAADGAVVHAATTGDTTLALPAAAVPGAGAAYEWWVRARLPDGSVRRSPMGRIVGR
jgi:hypothetical protein